MLSGDIVPRGTVAPVIIGIKTQPAGVVESAVHIVRLFGLFGFTVFLVSLLGDLRGQFGDGFIV